MDARFFEALEHQARIARLLASKEGRNYFDTLDGYATEETGDPTPLAEMHQSLWCAILEQATPYYWAPQMCAALKMAADILPGDTVLYEHNLPGPAGFWHFSQPLLLGQYEVGIEEQRDGSRLMGQELTKNVRMLPFYARGMAWAIFSDGQEEAPGERVLGIGLWLSTDDPALGEAFGPVVMRRFGQSPDGWAEESKRNILNLPIPVEGVKLDRITQSNYAQSVIVTSACLMLEQRLLVAPRTQVPRSSRKRMIREQWQHEPVVQVIELRRREHKASDSMEDHRVVEWSCQWMVGAHWRSQFYPSKGIHQRILIGPYIKGDPDKPLKQPSTRLFAVTR